MKQLILEANYHVNTHSHILINILRNGIHNEVVEYVKCSQPNLLHSHSFTCWESALIYADQVLKEIADHKHACNIGAGPPSYPLHNGSSKSSTVTALAVAAPALSSTKVDVHPNQPGTFGGTGAPMDIGKAHAEGKCAKCGGVWPCATHTCPRHNACFIQFKGACIFYQNAEGLKDAIKLVKKGFGIGE